MPRLFFVATLAFFLNGFSRAQESRRNGHDLQTLIGNRDEYSRLLTRLAALNTDIRSKGLHDLPGYSGKMITGYKYGEFYDWDLYFENLYLSYYGVSDFDFTNLKMFLDRQKPNGFVSRTFGITYPKPNQMFKPFLAQIAVLGSKQNGNGYEWLRGRYYDRLRKYLERWFEYDADHNGLPVWNSSDASGMDNQLSRSGNLDSFRDEGVDLACYLVRELEAMSIIAGHLGKKTDQEMSLVHARRLAALINKVFWDEKDGFYYDRNEKTGRLIKVKSVAGFAPLWAGVASREQADRLVRDHLLNPSEFWASYPIASYAKTEPDYYEGSRLGECNWRGPAWIPVNYIIFHGLLRYGYRDAARDLAIRTFRMALDVNDNTREYYDSDTGKGNGMNPFWGWSSLAYVMPLDYVNNYDPTDLQGDVKPLLKEQVGIDFVTSRDASPGSN